MAKKKTTEFGLTTYEYLFHFYSGEGTYTVETFICDMITTAWVMAAEEAGRRTQMIRRIDLREYRRVTLRKEIDHESERTVS